METLVFRNARLKSVDRPRLILDDLGINDRTLGVALIQWSEITHA